MNKVIFLDIGNVLNSNFRDNVYQQEISDGFLIDPDKIKLLSQLTGRPSGYAPPYRKLCACAYHYAIYLNTDDRERSVDATPLRFFFSDIFKW